MNNYKRVYATVNLDAIANNIEQMKKNIAPETKMIAVIKADGYGHGSVQIALSIEDYEYIWGFSVATAEEALILKRNNITKPILILDYVFINHYHRLIENEIRFTVFTYETAKELSDVAVELNKTVNIHIKLDTGMNRIGFKCKEENIAIIKNICSLPNLNVEGIFTHFAKADEIDKTSANMQLEKYKTFVKKIEEADVNIPLKHCSNSAGIIELKDANMDIVRAGVSIYGLYPSKEVNTDKVKLIPALELKSHIVNLSEVEPGEGISYGWTCITQKATRVATVPVGYADGYPRTLSNKGWVLIRGQKAPILGRVCMDQFMVDVTDIEGVSLKDEVTLVGKDGELSITAEDIGDLSGRFNYEFVCDLNKRVPRIFLKNNQVVAIKDYFNE